MSVNTSFRSFLIVLIILPLLYGCAKPLPVFGEVPQFSLTDQVGKVVSKKDLIGKIWIADFIYTGCGAACPMLTQNLSTTAKDLPGVRLVSFTVDPETDTPERLKEYADRFGAHPEVWSFLTGEVENVQSTVTEGFKLSIKKASEVDIFHSEKFVLVDKQGRIRGYFDSDAPGQRALKVAARQLQKEKEYP